MSRLAWITPGYPPDRGGVSDHSYAIVSALRAEGHEVAVYSNPHETGFAQLSVALAAFRPDAVVVAFVPLGYAPRTGGLAPAFVRWCSGLRARLAVPTLLLAHEASLPIEYHWQRYEFKLVALSIGQVVQFQLLARAFSVVVFSNEATLDYWSERMPSLRGRLKTIRICSNIPFTQSNDPRADLERLGYTVPPRVVLFFGSGHASVLFDYIEAAMRELLAVAPDVALVVVGTDLGKLRKQRPSILALGSSVQALGYVPSADVSLWLQAAEFVLGPFVEGVTARKGTVMAAFQHGRTVVTTRGPSTRTDIPWDQICALAPLNRDAFGKLAGGLLRDSATLARLGKAARVDYETHASAKVTAAKILAIAIESGRS